MTDELAALLTDLGRAGVELAADGERVRFRPRDRVGPDLLARIRWLKPILLALVGDPVRGGELPEAGSAPAISNAVWEAAYAYYERLGVADAAGLPTHVGSPAWLIAMAAAIEAEHTAMSGGELEADHG